MPETFINRERVLSELHKQESYTRFVGVLAAVPLRLPSSHTQKLRSTALLTNLAPDVLKSH